MAGKSKPKPLTIGGKWRQTTGVAVKPLMQTRQFEFIAAILRSIDNECLSKRFADELAKTNSQFKRERFLQACGVSIEDQQ